MADNKIESYDPIKPRMTTELKSKNWLFIQQKIKTQSVDA